MGDLKSVLEDRGRGHQDWYAGNGQGAIPPGKGFFFIWELGCPGMVENVRQWPLPYSSLLGYSR